METTIYKMKCGCVIRVENQPDETGKYHWWDLKNCDAHTRITKAHRYHSYTNCLAESEGYYRLDKLESSLAILQSND